jgi:hypothetical protein
VSEITITLGEKELLGSGIVIFNGPEVVLIRLSDGGEEISFEIVIQPTIVGNNAAAPQVKFDTVGPTTGRLTFINTTGPFGLHYAVPLGSINKKQLSANFSVSINDPVRTLEYSFWGLKPNG